MLSTAAATQWASWAIAAAATAGVILRPFSWPEWVWAGTGAVLLVALGLLSPADAWAGVAKGTDVCLFLLGMMLLAGLARQEGLLDWLAMPPAARWSRFFGQVVKLGSPMKGEPDDGQMEAVFG